MQPLRLPVVNPNTAVVKKMRPWLYAAAAFLILIFSFGLKVSDWKPDLRFFIFIAVAALCIVCALFSGKKPLNRPAFNALSRLVIALVFLLMAILNADDNTITGTILLIACAAGYVFLALVETRSMGHEYVYFSPGQLKIPTAFGPKIFNYSELEDLVLNNGMLTLLLPGDRFIQIDLAPEATDGQIDTALELFNAAKASAH